MLNLTARPGRVKASVELSTTGRDGRWEGSPTVRSETEDHRDLQRERLADPEFQEAWDRTALARAVAERLVTHRAERKLTQTALARRLRMKQPAVARLESGKHTPTTDMLWRLASRLDVESHVDITAHGVAI